MIPAKSPGSRAAPQRASRPVRTLSAGPDERRARAAPSRAPLGVALPIAREIEASLKQRVKSATVRIAGSVRRRLETVGNLNFIAASRSPDAVLNAFTSLPQVARIRGRERAGVRVRLSNGLDADLRVVPEASFGAALMCFTGSSAHHRALRRAARQRKLELSEDGLFRGDRRIAGRSEADVYRAIGLAFVPPELREDAGEIAAARDCALPPLIERGDLRGDLRVYVDARRPASIDAMAHAAQSLGFEYLALTLPSDGQRAAGAAPVLEHAAAVRARRDGWPGLRLLTGAEVAVHRDGRLALEDGVLAELDVVTAVVRDHLDQPRAAMTRRIIHAMENPHVDRLVAPAIRPVALEMGPVIAAAKRTGTVLAIEARPDRPGLRGEDVREALDAGVRVTIDSGAQGPERLAAAAELGIALARRGWARRCDVLNALPVSQCLCQLKDGRCSC
jgi:DNA polymerase (family 10)